MSEAPTIGSGVGRSNGVSRSQPFDRWFRYPAGFSPEALSACGSAIGLSAGHRIVDPFAGAATGGTYVANHQGQFVGIEAHPLVAELAALKFAALPQGGINEAIANLFERADRFEVDLDLEPALVRKSFSDAVLEDLVKLRMAIAAGAGAAWNRHLRWALIAGLRDVARVMVGWPYQRPDLVRAQRVADPRAALATRARTMELDLNQQPARTGRVVRADSRLAVAWRSMPTDHFDGCISSPPYLNNFDYADATRLELYFLGEATSWAEMCAKHRVNMVVATTQQTSVNRAARDHQRLKRAHPATGAAVEILRDALEFERRKRRRGKEYDQLITSYFHDLASVLHHLHSRLRPGTRSAWVVGDSAPYGVFVDTPNLLLNLAEETGFDPLETRLIRHRGLRWRTNGSRHQVPLHEKLILFERPA